MDSSIFYCSHPPETGCSLLGWLNTAEAFGREAALKRALILLGSCYPRDDCFAMRLSALQMWLIASAMSLRVRPYTPARLRLWRIRLSVVIIHIAG